MENKYLKYKCKYIQSKLTFLLNSEMYKKICYIDSGRLLLNHESKIDYNNIIKIYLDKLYLFFIADGYKKLIDFYTNNKSYEYFYDLAISNDIIKDTIKKLANIMAEKNELKLIIFPITVNDNYNHNYIVEQYKKISKVASNVIFLFITIKKNSNKIKMYIIDNNYNDTNRTGYTIVGVDFIGHDPNEYELSQDEYTYLYKNLIEKFTHLEKIT